MNRNVARHLDAARHGLRIPSEDPRFQAWCRQMCTKAFPGIDLRFHVLQIYSDQRTWHHIPTPDGPWIIADMELSMTLAEMKFLTQMDPWDVELSHLFLHPLLGDSMRGASQFAEHSLCTLRAFERRDLLGSLRANAMALKGQSALTLIAYLHELAHILVELDHPVAVFWRDAVDIAMEKIAVRTEEMATAPEQLAGLDLSPGLDTDDLTSGRLHAQMRQYVDRARGNIHLRREAVCDAIASMAFVNCLTGADLLLVAPRNPLPMTLLQLGDALLAVAETLKHMQLLTAVQSFAVDRGGEKTGGLNDTLVDMTSRSNVAVFLLNLVYRSVGVEQGKVTSSGFDRLLTKEVEEQMFLHAVKRLYRKVDQRLTEPMEDVTIFLADEARFDEAYVDAFGHPPDRAMIVPDISIEKLRRNLYV